MLQHFMFLHSSVLAVSVFLIMPIICFNNNFNQQTLQFLLLFQWQHPPLPHLTADLDCSFNLYNCNIRVAKQFVILYTGSILYFAPLNKSHHTNQPAMKVSQYSTQQYLYYSQMFTRLKRHKSQLESSVSRSERAIFSVV